MALTATATQGFEPAGKTSGHEVFYLPGDPGVTYTRGERVGIGGLTSEASATNGLGGVLKGPSVTGDKNLTGVVMKTTVCPAASQAFPKPKEHDPVYEGAANKTLVPVAIDVPQNVRIFHATFASHVDGTVATYTAGTRTVTGIDLAGDHYPIGAVALVYEGPGAGEVNVVEAYTHSGTSTIFHRAFAATLTSDSKMVILAGEAAVDAGIVHFDRSRGAALVDLNLDGLLDLVEVNRVANVNLFRSVGSGDAATPVPMGNWIAIGLEQPGVNPDAIGSWVDVKVGEVTVQSEVTIGGGHAGDQTGWIHFGLGASNEAEVRVQWPNGDTGPWMTVDANTFAVMNPDSDEPTVWTSTGD